MYFFGNLMVTLNCYWKYHNIVPFLVRFLHLDLGNYELSHPLDNECYFYFLSAFDIARILFSYY